VWITRGFVKNYHSQLHNSNINFAQQGNKKGIQPAARSTRQLLIK